MELNINTPKGRHHLRVVVGIFLCIAILTVYGLLITNQENDRTISRNNHLVSLYSIYTDQLLKDVDDMLYRVGIAYFAATTEEQKQTLREIWVGRQRDDSLVHNLILLDKHKNPIFATHDDPAGVQADIDYAIDYIVWGTPEQPVGTSKPFACNFHGGEQIFAITRTLYDDKGAVLGYVRASINIAEVERRYNELAFSSDTRITLLSYYGTILVRVPKDDTVVGLVLPAIEELAAAFPNVRQNSVQHALDGTLQMLALQKSAQYSLIVGSMIAYKSFIMRLLMVYLGLIIMGGLASFMIYRFSLHLFRADINEKTANQEEKLALQGQVEEALIKRIEAERRRRKHEKILIQQSKMASMGEMIGAIAHQWRQPLNSIGLYVQDLQDAHKYGELTDEYIAGVVSKTMQQLHFMSSTINDFRNFFKPDKLKDEFDLSKIVQNAIGLISAQLKAHGIDIQYEIPAEPLWCLGYENELGQAILNLLTNAKDALREKSEDDHKHIVVRLGNEDKTAVLEVEDNGGGIPETYIDRVFEPYFTTKEQGKGTGIGLYMTKMIVEENMHGKLSAYNIGGGVVFKIELPIVRTGAAEE